MRYTFGVFEFDRDTGELRKNGRAVALEPQPAKALALLVSRAGEVVSRDELRAALWGQDTHVDFDRGIAYCLSQIRAALGDSGDNPRFVQTIPKRGIKFVAPVAPPQLHTPAPSHPAIPTLPVLQAPHPMSSHWPPFNWRQAVLMVLIMGVVGGGTRYWLEQRGVERERITRQYGRGTVIAVSVFDNETGLAAHDRAIAGLSDLVVARLANLAPDRLRVIGNADILRQPRNIRNLKTVAEQVKADYVLLGQLQRGETGLRFITHFIRLRDMAHLKANRLPVADEQLTGLEDAVVQEFARATAEHALVPPSN